VGEGDSRADSRAGYLGAHFYCHGDLVGTGELCFWGAEIRNDVVWKCWGSREKVSKFMKWGEGVG